MSLESQITALVSAANKLTSEVANKMKGIDRKVDQATASVPRAIRAAADQVYYIDAANGDDSNSGLSGANALKTIAGVNNKIVPGGVVQITVREDQIHIVEGDVLRASGCSILVRSWGTATNIRPTIQWKPVYDPDNGINAGRGLALTNCSITFLGVNLDIANLENGVQLSGMSAFVFPERSHVNVYLRECEVTVNNAPFAASYAGYDSLDIHMNLFGFTRTANTNGRGMLLYNRAEPNDALQLRMSARGVTLRNGLSFKDILPIKADASNILTNIADVNL